MLTRDDVYFMFNTNECTLSMHSEYTDEMLTETGCGTAYMNGGQFAEFREQELLDSYNAAA